MKSDGIAAGSRRHATDSWREQFLQNVDVLTQLGVGRDVARELVSDFVDRAERVSPLASLHVFDDPSALDTISLLTEAEPEGRTFMLRLLSPVMAQVAIRGDENLRPLAELLGRVPITLMANHVSHLDAPAIFWALWHATCPGRDIADRLVFLAGLFVSQAQFARVGLSLFGSLLVCSPRDIDERQESKHTMGRINLRAFRQARRLQAEGRILALFPEGTRSPDGRAQPFLASMYRYLANTIVIPVRLDNLHMVLPNSGLLFRKAAASVNLGRPVLVGKVPFDAEAALSELFVHIEGAGERRTRQVVLDELAECVTSASPA